MRRFSSTSSSSDETSSSNDTDTESRTYATPDPGHYGNDPGHYSNDGTGYSSVSESEGGDFSLAVPVMGDEEVIGHYSNEEDDDERFVSTFWR